MDGERINNESLRRGEVAAAVSSGMVSLLREYTGRGPTKAKAMVNRDSVTVLLTDTLTKGERKLTENGHSDDVLQARHKMQMIMRDDAVSMVESLTGRKVVAFMSDNHIDPDMAAEVFVFEPVGDSAA